MRAVSLGATCAARCKTASTQGAEADQTPAEAVINGLDVSSRGSMYAGSQYEPSWGTPGRLMEHAYLRSRTTALASCQTGARTSLRLGSSAGAKFAALRRRSLGSGPWLVARPIHS